MWWLMLLSACRLFRPATAGLGTGMVVVSEEEGVQTPPMVVFDTRSVPNTDQPIGWVRRSSIVLHDPETTRRIGQWYLNGPPEQTPDSLVIPWYFLLFPTLLAAPLVGNHMAQGYGLMIQPHPNGPYVEAGPQFSVWVRPSSESMVFDTPVGVWMGVGMAVSDELEVAIRSSISQPLWHPNQGPIVDGALMLSIRRPPLLSKPAPTPDSGDTAADTGWADTGGM